MKIIKIKKNAKKNAKKKCKKQYYIEIILVTKNYILC